MNACSPAAAECLAFKPDIVVLGPFGKHDALSPIGWGNERPKVTYDSLPKFQEDDYYSGLHEMAHALTRGSSTTLILALPVPFPSGSTEHAVAKLCLPATKRLAEDLHVLTADLYTPFTNAPGCFPDNDHLDNPATDTMVEIVAQAVRDAAAKIQAKL